MTCVIGEDIGTRKENLDKYTEDIRDMLSQIDTEQHPYGRYTLFCLCHIRKDGEQWTPYLQVIKMLLLLGKRLNFVHWDGELNKDTVIIFNL